MSSALADFVEERWGDAKRVSWGGEPQLLFPQCPNCGKEWKFTVSLKKALANCYSCQYGTGTNVYALLADWEGVSVDSIKEIIRKRVWLVDDDVLTKDPKIEEDDGTPEDGYPLNWKKDFLDPLGGSHLAEMAHKYLTGPKRKLDDRTIEKYQIRVGTGKAREPWDVFHKRACVPLFEDGKVVYFVGRSIEKDPKLKYRNPKKKWTKKSASELVFQIDSACEYDPVVLVEGVFDAIAAGPWAGALLGKRLHYPQGNLLYKKGVRNVVALFDADVPMDERKALDVDLKNFFKRVYWVDPSALGAKDPGEMDYDDIVKVIRSAKQKSSMDFTKIRYSPLAGQHKPPWER